MLQYSIGNANFLEMSGMPDFIKIALEVVERPGVDGAAFIDIGWRGRPFQIQTKVDCYDYLSAVDLFEQYCEMVGGDPVDVIFMGLSLSQYDVQFQILDVRPINICQMAGGIGGLNPPSCGLCEVAWTLLCIPNN